MMSRSRSSASRKSSAHSTLQVMNIRSLPALRASESLPVTTVGTLRPAIVTSMKKPLGLAPCTKSMPSRIFAPVPNTSSPSGMAAPHHAHTLVNLSAASFICHSRRTGHSKGITPQSPNSSLSSEQDSQTSQWPHSSPASTPILHSRHHSSPQSWQKPSVGSSTSSNSSPESVRALPHSGQSPTKIDRSSSSSSSVPSSLAISSQRPSTNSSFDLPLATTAELKASLRSSGICSNISSNILFSSSSMGRSRSRASPIKILSKARAPHEGRHGDASGQPGPQREKPQDLQTVQPPSSSMRAPHSGHLMSPITAGSAPSPSMPYTSRYLSIARPIASGQESTSACLLRIEDMHRIPLSCSVISAMSIPARSPSEISRLVASDCDGQPPALPSAVNTSQMPASSALTVM